MKNIFYIIFSTFFLFSCEKDSGPYIVTSQSQNLPPTSFLNDIQPIFDSYCISCHDETHADLNLKTCCSWDQLLNTGTNAPYVNTSNPTESLIYKRITGVITPQMPFGTPLSTSDKQLILKWIQEGAQNN